MLVSMCFGILCKESRAFITCLYKKFRSFVHTVTHFNPHPNMRGPRGPRKTLKAAQTLVIGIPEIEQAKTDPGCA